MGIVGLETNEKCERRTRFLANFRARLSLLLRSSSMTRRS